MFDVGDTLVPWRPRDLFVSHFVGEAALDRFLGFVATADWHVQHDAGRPFAETSTELIERFPEDAAAIRLWGERFVDTIGPPLPGMAEIVHDLDAAGVPLFAITNFSREFWPAFAAREAALLAPFRDILVSGEVRLLKPDPAIFAMARDRFGLSEGAALFVDDRPENVTAAEAAGFVGHRFEDAACLRAVLHGFGLLS